MTYFINSRAFIYLRFLNKVYAVAENTDLANEGASDDGFTD